MTLSGQRLQEQRGVVRTNCIDCLDRTNVTQVHQGVTFFIQNVKSDSYKIGFLSSVANFVENGSSHIFSSNI